MRKIDAIEEAVREAHTPEEVPEPPVEAKEDARYITLKKPLISGTRTLEKLLCDCTDLSGEQYFALCNRFRNEYHYIYATSVNKLSEDVFQAMVIAELNGIPVEDLRRISFGDMHRVCQRLQRFLYGEG